MKIKKLLSFAPIISTIPIVFVLSAETDNNSDNNNNENAPKEKTDFVAAKEKQKQIISERLPEILDDAIKNIDLEIAELERKNEVEPNIENLVKIAYQKKVIQYLNNNKEKMVADPLANGLNFIFDDLLFSPSYYFANVKYLGNPYDNVMIGESNPLDYAKTKDIDKNSKIDYGKEKKLTENNLTQEKILLQHGTYLTNFANDWKTIFVNENDFPNYENNQKRFEVKADGSIELLPPEGYENFDSFIANNINKRSLEFDLKQNKEFNEPEEMPQPPIPPILPIDPEPVEGIEIDVAQENVPRLSPILRADYLLNSNQNLINLLNTNSTIFNQDAIFFFNPILQNISYRVIELREDQNGNLLAKIQLTNNTNNTQTTYERTVTKYNDSKYVQSLEVASNAINQMMQYYYNALNIKADLDLSVLGNRNLSIAVFNQIFLAIQTINSSQFKILQDALIQDQKNNTTIKANNETFTNELTNENLISLMADLFTNSIHNQTISRLSYFSYLTSTYREIYNNYLKQLKDVQLNELITKNFALLNLNIENLNKAINSLPLLILDLDHINSENNFDQEQFKAFNTKLALLQQQFLNLAVLTQNKTLDQDNLEQESSQYLKAYNDLIIKQNLTSNATSTTTLITLGVVIAVLIVSVITLSIMNSTTKKQKIKELNNGK